jgi:hypothetical protein
MPMLPLYTDAPQLMSPDPFWLSIQHLAPRSVYSCYSTGQYSMNSLNCAVTRVNASFLLGHLGEGREANASFTGLNHDIQQRVNILGPKHFIVEEENEALLAKEFQEAKIQSVHNSFSSMHGSQPHLPQVESNELALHSPYVRDSWNCFPIVDRSFLSSYRSIV